MFQKKFQNFFKTVKKIPKFFKTVKKNPKFFGNKKTLKNTNFFQNSGMGHFYFENTNHKP